MQLSLHLFMLALLASMLAQPAMASPRLFGTGETASYDLGPFPKWTKVVNRQPADFERMQRECKAESCDWKRWNGWIESLRQLPAKQQLKQLNQKINNEIQYIEDIDNWGKSDVWTTTYTFLNRNGDCEDFAITKYYALKALGYREDQLRIVVLKDTNLQILHAVLAVYLGNDIYILDNQTDYVASHRSIRHYKPIYSVNERGWWRHKHS